MATATALISLGNPAETAKRIGYEQVSITTTAAATQGSGQLVGPGNKLVSAISHANTGSITLPVRAEIGDEIIITNVTGSALTLNVYPPTGERITGVAVNTNVAAFGDNLARNFIKVAAGRWASWLTVA